MKSIAMHWTSVKTDYLMLTARYKSEAQIVTRIPIIYSNLLVTCDIFEMVFGAATFFSLPLNVRHSIVFS